MKIRFLSAWLLAFVSLFAAVSRAEPPKLVVLVVVDQLRYDYLERSPHLFTANGFRLLLDRGAFMTTAKFDYFPTITGPGHATVLSGVGPAGHGIIGNEWFDKKTGKDLYCCADTNVTAVGTTNKIQMSPRNFIGATVADQMRLAWNSKVIGISLKDRAAILPSGKKAHGAFWFESKTASFITSSYYMTNLPTWVTEFNEKKIPQSYANKTWERLHPIEEYTFDDAAVGEGKLNKETNSVFPHTINLATNNVDAVTATPFGDEVLTQFAFAAIDGEQLGQGNKPDMLTVSFSSNDMCGHNFGPYSHEIQDLMFRLDRQFEKLFNHIDEKVGLNNTVIVLASDHGVAPVPEFATAMGLDGHRWNSGSFMTNLLKGLEEKFGAGKFFRTMKISHGDIFLNHDVLREKGLSVETVSSFIREHALATGLFQAVFTREQLLNGTAPGWIGKAVLNGYNAERGADLMLMGKPFGFASTGKTGTSHGTVYSYDTRIPVIFFGKPFKAGRYPDEFYMTDIAPTLSAALGILEPPGSVGKVAVRILAGE